MALSLPHPRSVCPPDILCHKSYWRPCCYTDVCLPRCALAAAVCVVGFGGGNTALV